MPICGTMASFMVEDEDTRRASTYDDRGPCVSTSSMMVQLSAIWGLHVFKQLFHLGIVFILNSCLLREGIFQARRL